MAGISNIIGAYNINPKRVSSKLSFEIGQVFAAKIVSPSELNREIILKLLDGWQFTAKLQNPLDFVPEGMTKFQVEGFQDGKLQIKLINNKDEKQKFNKSSLEELVSEGGIDVDKDDYEILKKMVKHNMPLTKENITQVKTLVDFREKLIKRDDEAHSFILKYANSKNIDINSVKSKEINQTLKSFFNELKNISEDELLTLLENGIEVNEENIKSFTKIFREESSIYKELRAASEKLEASINKSKNIAKLDKSTIEGQVNEQLINKTEEMKNIIKNLISEEKGLESKPYSKVLQILKENINDFKVFNSVSNQYYCLNIPVNINKDEYQCKLLIKDDRKYGKKIDSKNVSLVVSVKTISIGVVDAYIKVREQNMKVDIKCEEAWVKILSVGKNMILKELSSLGYNVYFSVDKKEAEANLTNCREFFQDSELGSINTRV